MAIQSATASGSRRTSVAETLITRIPWPAGQPAVAVLVGGHGEVMLAAVDFDAKLRRGAVEIEDVRLGGMLMAEAEAASFFAECGPQEALGEGRVSPELAGAVDGGLVAAVFHGFARGC